MIKDETGARRACDSLSPRERHILALAAEGLADKEIAVKMGISMGTVRTYWQRMRDKTNARSRSEILSQLLQQEHSQAVHRLKVAGEMYAAVFHGSAAALAVLDKKGQIVEVNPAFCERLHAQPADLIGSRFDDIHGLTAVTITTDPGTTSMAVVRLRGAGPEDAYHQAHRQEVKLGGELLSLMTLIPLSRDSSVSSSVSLK